MTKIVVTGAAGLVGQNLVARLKNRNGYEIVAIDKHDANVALFRKLHPGVRIVLADLANDGTWQDEFAGADAVIIGHAQIGGLVEGDFWRNNVLATRKILHAIDKNDIAYFVGISSSVVNSQADDFYTRTKGEQEALFDSSNVPHVVLRPTLMFGWFDRKHLGWLRRYMDRVPIFPIPGDGKYLRQPLYAGDFVSIIASCVDRRTVGTYDISGRETLSYGALIRLIHRSVGARSRIVHIPFRIFWMLLWIYGLFDRNPPFTTRQLEALVIAETFPIIDWPEIFQIKATPLPEALKATYVDSPYSNVILEF